MLGFEYNCQQFLPMCTTDVYVHVHVIHGLMYLYIHVAYNLNGHVDCTHTSSEVNELR